MTARRLTSEQQRAVTQLRAVAAPYRFRVVVDAEGRVIRAKRWGGSGRGRSENFAVAPGQPATSRRSEPRNAGSQG
jgi:hypothetical protein